MIIGLIEDSPKLAEILSEGLELSGNHVIIYESRQEATTALLEARFQNVALPIEVLVVDLDSGQDGTREISTIRQFITPQELPILFLSGQGLAERNVLGQSLSESRVLSKPVTPENILEALKEEVTTEQH